VVEVLNRLVRQHGAPRYLFADNGSEFTGHLVDLWAYRCKVRIDFSRPGKPTDNAFIETFNGSLRDECLNLHWFKTVACGSAAGFGADQHHIALKSPSSPGSHTCAGLQSGPSACATGFCKRRLAPAVCRTG